MEHNDWLSQINAFLQIQGYCTIVETINDRAYIVVNLVIELKEYQLLCQIDDDFPYSFPAVHLKNRLDYGHLAHIGWNYKNDIYAPICIGTENQFSANFECPHEFFLAYLESSINVLTKALSDKEFNEQEILNEFVGNWRFLQKHKYEVICMAKGEEWFEYLTPYASQKTDLEKYENVILANLTNLETTDKASIISNIKSSKRKHEGKAYVLRIDNVTLPPSPHEDLKIWYTRNFDHLSQDQKLHLLSVSKNTRSKKVYLVLHSIINGKKVWFGFYCTCESKQNVPLYPDFLGNWKFEAILINSYTKQNLLPRANNGSLQEKKVMVVGCGSLGGYIADMLAGSGVGELALVDKDLYKIENIYRHYLPAKYIGLSKTDALKEELEQNYPFTKIISIKKLLKDIMDNESYRNFDLVILATGDITSERIFNQFLKSENCNNACVFTWVEPLGIGGHGVLSIPNVNGCLNCIMIDRNTDALTLNPSINFLKPDQDVAETESAGCGTLYIPYSNIDAVTTAAMVSKLAVKYLSNKIIESCTVSWRGESTWADQKGVKLTHRFYRFTKQYEYIPISKDGCYVCNNSTA